MANCAEGWHNREGSCYYFSFESSNVLQTFEGADNQCKSRGAHLVVVGNEEENVRFIKYYAFLNKGGE